MNLNYSWKQRCMQHGHIWVLNQVVNIFILVANGLQTKNGRVDVTTILSNIYFKNKLYKKLWIHTIWNWNEIQILVFNHKIVLKLCDKDEKKVIYFKILYQLNTNYSAVNGVQPMNKRVDVTFSPVNYPMKHFKNKLYKQNLNTYIFHLK